MAPKKTRTASNWKLAPTGIDPLCNVTVHTIQRLLSQLMGRDLDNEAQEKSTHESATAKKPLPGRYNPAIPIEKFDFVIVDE